MVALLGFFETVQVLFERCFGIPCRAVNALQHWALFVAAPICASDLHQLEVAESRCGGHVRATTHIDEVVGVAVHADRAVGVYFARIDADFFVVGIDDNAGKGTDALDDLALVWLIGEQR
ncbi:unannotated protein [freshwater metagenome]|uniref:Unannotated protein n=1 Tax=freshwater metagenome TaxID=449393 RepID=A0A6J6XED8_9ZZZZ